MDFKKIKETVLESWDANELYNTEIELQEFIGECYQSKKNPNNQIDESEVKAQIELAILLQGICRDRLPQVKSRGAFFNYNFNMIAKLLLPKDKYDAIAKDARLSRPELKAKYGILKKNK